jgi:D-lactate dehydrogenase
MFKEMLAVAPEVIEDSAGISTERESCVRCSSDWRSDVTLCLRVVRWEYQVKIAVFNTKPYTQDFMEPAAKAAGFDFVFFEPRLHAKTCVLARGFDGVCVFVNDQLDSEVLQQLATDGIRLIALRCAGFNNVDLKAAGELGMTVVRVPAYSPYAVAEHTAALILSLNRKIHKAYNRVREANFSLENLLGFDLNGRDAGIVGTGKIGAVTAKILHGFGCKLKFFDLTENPDCAQLGEYVAMDQLLSESDIISLHCPLTPDTKYLIDETTVAKMRRGVMLINTSRGQLIKTQAVIDGLKSGRIGYLGLDVYEEEADLFFEDLSHRVIQDDAFTRLLTFPNVIITGHQAFFTEDAMSEIARVTMNNIRDFANNAELKNEVTAERVVK